MGSSDAAVGDKNRARAPYAITPTPPDRALARTVALLALACVLWLVALTGPGRADDGGSLQITTCDQSAADCSSGGGEEIQVEQQPAPAPVKSQPKPAAKPAPQPTAKGTERHDVSLATGQDTVQTSDGVTADQADVATAPSEKAKLKRDAEKDADSAPEPDSLGAVTTDAGSPFSGFGSGLSYLSPDEALSRFAIPPFLLPIYVAAGRAYGVPWNLLAAINQIETDFGRIGPRSPRPAPRLDAVHARTWAALGRRRVGDGIADPYNPVDAIYAAARYLKASGAPEDLRGAVLAYNHADWYADSVLKNAGIYGSLPGGLVDETGSLAFGRFPLLGTVRYGDDFRSAQQAHRTPHGIAIHGGRGALAVATQQVVVKRILLGPELAAAMRTGGATRLERHRARAGDLANITSRAGRRVPRHGEPVTLPCAAAAIARPPPSTRAPARRRRRAARRLRRQRPCRHRRRRRGPDGQPLPLRRASRGSGPACARGPRCAGARASAGSRAAATPSCASRCGRPAAPPSTRGRSSTATACRRRPTSPMRSGRSAATRSCRPTTVSSPPASSAAASGRSLARSSPTPASRSTRAAARTSSAG